MHQSSYSKTFDPPKRHDYHQWRYARSPHWVLFPAEFGYTRPTRWAICSTSRWEFQLNCWYVKSWNGHQTTSTNSRKKSSTRFHNVCPYMYHYCVGRIHCNTLYMLYYLVLFWSWYGPVHLGVALHFWSQFPGSRSCLCGACTWKVLRPAWRTCVAVAQMALFHLERSRAIWTPKKRCLLKNFGRNPS